jgi:hypothetical protein
LKPFSATAIHKVHHPVQGEGFPDKPIVSDDGRGFEQRIQDSLFRRFDGRLKERGNPLVVWVLPVNLPNPLATARPAGTLF